MEKKKREFVFIFEEISCIIEWRKIFNLNVFGGIVSLELEVSRKIKIF